MRRRFTLLVIVGLFMSVQPGSAQEATKRFQGGLGNTVADLYPGMFPREICPPVLGGPCVFNYVTGIVLKGDSSNQGTSVGVTCPRGTEPPGVGWVCFDIVGQPTLATITVTEDTGRYLRGTFYIEYEQGTGYGYTRSMLKTNTFCQKATPTVPPRATKVLVLIRGATTHPQCWGALDQLTAGDVKLELS